MTDSFDFDLAILGGGPAGYVAAIRAKQLGIKKIAVLEKDKPGGVCLNWGCVPSKALIHQAEVFRTIPGLEAMGIAVDKSGLDFEKVFKKSRRAAEMLSKGVQFLLKKNAIELVAGEFSLSGSNVLQSTEGKTVSAKNILLATGSRPSEIPGFPFDEDFVLSSTGALQLKKLPESILIVGSGAIGMEFAHVWNAFGVQVHVVEMLDRILPLEDEECVAVLRKGMEKRGIQFYTATQASSMKIIENGVAVILKSMNGKETEVVTDKVLVAVGRSPNTENLGLEKLGIPIDKGFVVVGDHYQTKVKSIYAIGDIIASPLLAHVASMEGTIAVEYITGHATKTEVDKDLIPNCTYCEPQVASFGYTEQHASQEGLSYKKVVFPYRGAGKSVCIEKPDGLIKIIFDPKTKKILGGHIVGAEATELIHEILLAKKADLLPVDIATMMHAHPTLSEGLMEAMRAVEGWVIHA